MKRQLSNPTVVAALALVLAGLAALQYRWIGEISTAERERLQRGLETSARLFRGEVNRRIHRLAEAFWIDPRRVEAGSLEAVENLLVQRWEEYRVSSDVLFAIESIYLAAGTGEGATVRRLGPDDAAFLPAELPAELAGLLDGERRRRGGPGGGPGFGRPGSWTFFKDQRTLAAPVVRLEGQGEGRRPRFQTVGGVYVVFDRRQLAEEAFPTLTERYFGATADGARVSILERGRERDAVFGRWDERAARPVVEIPLLWGRDEASRGMIERMRRRREPPPGPPDDWPRDRGLGAEPPPPGERPGTEFFAGFSAVSEGPGPPWVLAVTLAEGSLDAVVARTRRRNLAVSFGVLLLLAVGMGIVLTSARRAERLAAMQMEFVAGVSHELRTPLAVIRSAGENLAEGVASSPERVKEYGALVRDEGRRLSEMVDQTLEFAGAQSGRGRAEVRAFDAANLLGELTDELKPEAEREGCPVSVSIPADLPRVRADQGAVRLVLRNLLQNAGKYGAGSEVEVVAEGAPRSVRVKVRDRGPGIPPEDAAHIFEPFYRGRHAADHHIRGTGLGLSLAKNAAESFGGKLSVESRPGQETVFSLELPRAEGDE